MKYLIPILLMVLIACGQKEHPQENINETKINNPKETIQKPQKLSKEDAVLHIREMFSKINDKTSSAEVIEKDLLEESTEGGQLKLYKHDGKIIKLILLAFGETGKATKEYYFENEKLIFVFTKDEYYDRPMYIEGAKISKIEENRYYFYNEKLFKWLDPEKKEINIATAHEAEEEILNSCTEYLKLFESE